MNGISARLVDHALALEWAQVSTASQHALVDFLHDSIAVGVAGRGGANADAMLALAQGWGAEGPAPVLGRPGVALPPAGAAFCNAFQIHCQEYDCVHEDAVLHPMATVLAASLAEIAAGPPVTGADFLAGIAAGIDVATALGLASGPLSFFRPATAGIFGCTMALARMRRLPAPVARDALGHALAFASGTMQPHREGKPALPIQVGNAARGGVCAVELARLGIAGVDEPIEGPFGYFALLEVEAFPERLGEALAQPGGQVARVSWKPFPTGRAGHGGIVAMQQMVAEHGLTAADLEIFAYHAPPLIARLVGRPALPGMAPGYARLCLPWLAAVTLLHGKVGLTHFTPQYLADPALLALAARIRVVADGNPDPAAFVPAVAIARLGDGRELRVEIAAQLGAPDFPLTRAQHLAKAADCLAFGGLPGCAKRLENAVASLADAPDALAAIRASGVFG